MIMVALNYKEVFVVLSGRESLFKNPPLNEDWEKVEKICELLEVFNDITLVFSASKYPTTNNYFPCICGLRIAMSNWLSSPCDYIKKMVLVMLEKYNKYWADVNGLMGVATILDPRFKLKLIHFYFEKNYESFTVQAEIDRIEGLLHDLVDEYGSRNGKNQASKSKTKSVGFFNTKGKGTMLNEFAEFVEQNNTAISEKFDLDRYLETANILFVDDFDILNWWKTNGNNYSTLQQIAKDILSIPVSTVPSESAFSTGGRVIGPYRSRLLPETIEALMCAQNWLWADIKGSSEFKLERSQLEEIENDDCNTGVSDVTSIA
ncbi:hypothetical protein F3Y22_tig00112215pilonHSYRG00241 [Hibiscus syriacus]|uniref:HAT C-terminal dimerisation domain-containing protein n=1 Tax=Hibiscus syriacus TaxID=106335 RepID=A0A6A2Y2Y1_HIBSY|nr:hypothetical protein F3Y22_tig00112215pilonHSYRG00241 [Hibiscus syriacus]